MWCASSLSSTRYQKPLQLHVVVDQPLSQSYRGRVVCKAMGVPPFQFSWYGPCEEKVTTTEDFQDEARHLVPGTYRVVVTDAERAIADVTFDVEPIFFNAVVVVKAYKVVHPTTSSSRDGSVEALGQGLVKGMRYLWTNGSETREPVLHDVPCGTYAVHALPGSFGEEEKEKKVVVHDCLPVELKVNDHKLMTSW